MDTFLLVVSISLVLAGLALGAYLFKLLIETGPDIDKAVGKVAGMIESKVTEVERERQARKARKAEFLTTWSEIQPGLSEEEVVGLLGPPAEVIPVDPVIWRYHCENLSGFVMFQSGQVVGYKSPEEKASRVGRLFK